MGLQVRHLCDVATLLEYLYSSLLILVICVEMFCLIQGELTKQV